MELYNNRWKKRLLQLCEEEPENYKLIEEDGERLVFEMNKQRLRLPNKKIQLSDVQRAKRLERLASAREKR